jgi:hypothetical protein
MHTSITDPFIFSNSNKQARDFRVKNQNKGALAVGDVPRKAFGDDADSNRRGILHKELSNICPLASVRMTSRVGFPCAPGSRLYSSGSWEHYYNSHISRGIKRPSSGLRCTFWAYDALVLAAPNLVDMCGASRQDRWLPRSSSLAPSS